MIEEEAALFQLKFIALASNFPWCTFAQTFGLINMLIPSAAVLNNQVAPIWSTRSANFGLDKGSEMIPDPDGTGLNFSGWTVQIFWGTAFDYQVPKSNTPKVKFISTGVCADT